MSTELQYHFPERESFARGLLDGVLSPARGILYTLENSSLWKYLLIPCLVMFFIMGLTLVGLYFQGGNISEWIQGIIWVPNPNETSFIQKSIVFIYQWGVSLGVWIIGIIGAYTIGIALAPPLTEGLSTAICEKEGWTFKGPTTSLATSLLKNILESIISLLVYILIICCLFFLSLIPFLGLCAPIIGVFVTSFFMAKELLEIPMSAQSIPLKQRLKYLWHYRFTTLGFGGTCALLMMLPLANLFIFPFLIVAATLLYYKHPAQLREQPTQ